VREFDGKADMRQCATQLVACLGDGLADLQRQQPAQAVGVALECLRPARQQGGTLGGFDQGPAATGLGGGCAGVGDRDRRRFGELGPRRVGVAGQQPGTG
jgi:hypothetical protein